MNSIDKICKKCKTGFVIEPDDISFYEKMGVCHPDMCPDCRSQLRLSFRNERVFYHRKCDKCNIDTISMFSPNKDYPVWCYDCWWSDDFNGVDYAKEYDPSRPFFEQFNELWNLVPKSAMVAIRSVNSQYLNYAADNKNCYMIMESSNNEDCINCYWIQLSKDLVDCSFTNKVERSYESDDCYDSYGLQYSKGCHSCTDSYFLLNCRGCTDCIGCINLRQQKYCIFNEQYSKEEYEKIKKELKLDTHSGVESLRAKFKEFIKGIPNKFAEITQAVNSTGNYMTNVKNNRSCFHSYEAEDCAYSVHAFRGAKDCVDCNTAGRSAEKIYNTLNTGLEASNIICGFYCWSSQFMEYCLNSPTSNNCFGCVGMRKQSYCILNKQYNKETYKKLRMEIIEKINKEEGGFGNFYPAYISALGYNESSAMTEFPLTKEDALAQGFKWEDTPRGTYGKETKKWEEVPDSINDVVSSGIDVPKEIFVCENNECKKNFRIIENEFLFYKKLSIPLPHLCPECRHTRRFVARGPNKLWHRKCMNVGCENEFETSYSPERREIIYCESCYQNIVL